jgi:hypothetical protein
MRKSENSHFNLETYYKSVVIVTVCCVVLAKKEGNIIERVDLFTVHCVPIYGIILTKPPSGINVC